MIYLLWANWTPLYKIGYSARSVQNRAKEIQAMSPVPLTLIAAAEGSRTTEAELHVRFRNNRVNGEWFKLKNDQALELLETYGALKEMGSSVESNHPAWFVLLWMAAEGLHKAKTAHAIPELVSSLNERAA